MAKRIVLKISGRVQGVFFRESVRQKAEELNLAGWVRNEPDGAVKIVVEGEEINLQKLISWIQNSGPEYAEVSKVEIDWQKPTGEFKDFVIK